MPHEQCSSHEAKQPALISQHNLAQLVRLCKLPSCQHTQEHIWFIRDRLHESSSFFRLWPSQLQQLLCRLAQAQQWVQHEVLAAAGSKPEELCFILDGQAAVAVRAAPGSSLLKDVAVLKAGDSFGELCLLGKQRHPAFVVVRSQLLTGLTVNARELAAAMQAAPKQVSSSKPTCTGSSSSSSSSSSSQAQAAGDIKQAPSQLLSLASGQQDTMSVDALYQFIGQPRDQPTATLNHQQAQQVQQLYSKQLQEAAAAETATVGSWQQLPHERLPDATAKVCVRKPGGSNSKSPTGRTTTAVLDVDSEAGCVDVRGTSSRGGSAAQAQSSSHLPVTYRDGQGQPTGTAGAQQQQQQQPGVPLQTPEDAVQDRGQLGQQQAPRSAAMHHAAIMHFTALRAAAGGQPLS